jgi:hypothetical protein
MELIGVAERIGRLQADGFFAQKSGGSIKIKSSQPSRTSAIWPFNQFAEAGGEDRIRTCGGREPPTVFETAAFNHSATSPG